MACSNGTHGDSECSVELKQKIDEWLKWDENKKTRGEIETLVNQQNWLELEKMLLKRLAFGTAGLRAVMRAGFSAMNDLVVIQTAQGLAKYIKQCFPTPEQLFRGVVYGYDGRYNSKRHVFRIMFKMILMMQIFILITK